jgi:hypothetical protein
MTPNCLPNSKTIPTLKTLHPTQPNPHPTRNDVSVPYCTAAMTLTNPYARRPAVAIDPRYPSVVRPALEGELPAAAPAKVGAGMVAAMVLSPMIVPLLPVMYLGYIGSTLVHHKMADKKAPDAGWVMEQRVPSLAHAHGALTRLHAMGRLVSGDFAAAAAAAAEMMSRRRSDFSDGEYGLFGVGSSRLLPPATSVVVARAADYVAGKRSVDVARGPAVLGHDLDEAELLAAAAAAAEEEELPQRGGAGAAIRVQLSVAGRASGAAAAWPPQQPASGLATRSSILLPPRQSLNRLGSRPTLRPGPVPAGLHTAATLARADSLGLGLGSVGLGSLLLPGGHSFTSAGPSSPREGRGGAAAWGPVGALGGGHAAHPVQLSRMRGGSPAAGSPQHPAAQQDDASPFAAVQQGASGSGGGSSGGGRAPPGHQEQLPTLKEEATCGSTIHLASVGGRPQQQGATADGGDCDASPFAAVCAGAAAADGATGGSPAAACEMDPSPFAVAPPAAMRVAAPSPLPAGGSPSPVPAAPDSPAAGAGAAGLTQDEGDAAELRKALDSVLDTERRALLAGRGAPPEDHEGVLTGSGLREQQEWMAKQLRKMRWRHVDADVGNVRSHAAVVNRDRLFGQSARLDVLDYVTDHFLM